MKTFFRLIRNLFFISLFLIAHFFLFIHYSEIQNKSEGCVAKVEMLQSKLDKALVPEESITAYVSENLYPRVKQTVTTALK
jgi:hypothetical protein